MPHSQSNLTSLATLLQNAEARRIATPPPPAPPGEEDDSGLIDIAAMQKKAYEDRTSELGAGTKTPVPVVRTVRTAETDPDFVASLVGARRRKHVIIGALVGVVAVSAVALGFGGSRHRAAASRAEAVEPSVAVTVVTPPPPAPAPAPPAPDPVAVAPAQPIAAAAEPASATGPAKGKGKKHKGSHSSKVKGPKLQKVTSGGT